MAEIKYEIVKNIGVLSKASSGWSKEVNLISWNDRDAPPPPLWGTSCRKARQAKQPQIPHLNFR